MQICHVDPSAFDHELGHFIVHQKLKRDEIIEPDNKPNMDRIEGLYNEPLSEAWPNSFADFINYPDELEYDAPDIYEYWHNFLN